MKRNWVLFLALLLLGIWGIIESQNPAVVEAQGCSVNLSMDPSGPSYSSGTAVQLRLQSDCRTVKFTIHNQNTGDFWNKAEIGAPNQTETWRTQETGGGTLEVCAVGRVSESWDNAARSCRTVYVLAGEAPPTNQDPGSDRCWVSSFTVTPSTAPQGHIFNFAGQGQCDRNARASRFSIDGGPGWGEHASNTNSATWNSGEVGQGNHRICFYVVAEGSDWDRAAQSCTNITVTAPETQPSHDTSQGPPTTGNSGSGSSSGGSNPSSGSSNPPVNNPPSPPSAQNNNSGNSGSSSSNSAPPVNNNPPAAICPSALSLSGQARVTPGPANNLRSGAGTSYGVIAQIPGGGRFTIVGGPVCANGYNWWQVRYNGTTGWTAEGPANNRWLEPVGVQSSGSSISTTSPGSSSPSNSSANSCPSALNLSGQARVTPGAPNNMRSGAGTGNGVVGQIPGGAQFTVLSGPVCANGYNWWRVRYNGTTGWTAEGPANDRWLEALGSQIDRIQVRYFGQVYEFEVDTVTCSILNGAEIVSQEIVRSVNWARRIQTTQIPGEFYLYLKNEGEIDTFRVVVDSYMVREAHCENAYYQIGNNTMDLYGLGNVLYGYHSVRFPSIAVHGVADLDQLSEDHRLDFPDDASQINWGREIARNGATDPGSIISLIPSNFVSSR